MELCFPMASLKHSIELSVSVESKSRPVLERLEFCRMLFLQTATFDIAKVASIPWTHALKQIIHSLVGIVPRAFKGRAVTAYSASSFVFEECLHQHAIVIADIAQLLDHASRMVPRPFPSLIVPLTTPDRLMKKVSSSSARLSARMVTLMVLLVSPGAKVRLPFVAR